MSVRMTSLVWQLPLSGNQLVIMLAIADEADSDGVCFTGQQKLAGKARVSERTVRRTLLEMRDAGLLHTERRPAEWARGRRTDAIILDPGAMLRHGQEVVEPIEERRQRQINRLSYEVDPGPVEPEGNAGDQLPAPPAVEAVEPVDNPVGDQPDIMTGKYVSPSQDQPDILAGRSFNRTNRVVQPDKSDTDFEGALIGSRARLYPSNPIQSSEPVAVENSGAAGSDPIGSGDEPTQGSPGGQPPGGGQRLSVAGVPLRLLRGRLGGDTGVLAGLDDVVVAEVIRVVMARAAGPVLSPMGLMIAALRDRASALDTIEEAMARVESRQPQGEDHRPVASSPARRQVTCRVHHSSHLQGQECPGCRADRIVARVQEA